MTMTIEEYLDELPEPWRTKALANMLEDAADLPVDSFTDALLDAFRFETSPEGAEYWWALLDELGEDDD